MHILTKRNGIALVAVLAILLVLTLLLPVMFSMSERATVAAMEGTDIQRSSYFARSLIEMTVGTFKENCDYEVENPNEFQKSLKQMFYNANIISEKNGIGDDGNPIEPVVIKTEPVGMYVKIPPQLQNAAAAPAAEPVNKFDDIVYSNQAEVTDDVLAGYEKIGEGTCEITCNNSKMYYLIDSETQNYYELTKEQYERLLGRLDVNQNASGKLDKNDVSGIVPEDEYKENSVYTVTLADDKKVNFKSEATVNGKKTTRRCVVYMPTHPSEKQWLLYHPESETQRDVFADPSKATGRANIDYSDGGITDDDYNPQALLIYSCVGNMVIDKKDLKAVDHTKLEDPDYSQAKNGFSLQLGVTPSLNVTDPEGDPTYGCIKAVNAHKYSDEMQRDNFIAFSATNTLTVDYPINLLVNPARAHRAGDGMSENTSIYKSLIFQAPDINLNSTVEMMCSFYVPRYGADARRISSVVLSAPKNTKYTYRNDDRGGVDVKAGKVFFGGDCYLYIINFGHDGSGYAKDWLHSYQTVYYKHKDFTKIKIASAGDVCYYNAEITRPSKNDANKKVNAGFSLTGYGVEAIYMEDYRHITTEATPWWQVWEKTQQAIFGAYIKMSNRFGGKMETTYVKDDLHKIGNIYDGTATVDIPEDDELYTIWFD